jgi:hypothetical protein
MKARWCLSLLMLAAVRLWAEPEIEFSGVLAAGSETKVALKDKVSGESRWVKLGQAFEGFVVSAYEAATEVVVLTKDGQKFRLPLKTAKIKSGVAIEPTPEIKKAILNNLRQLAAAADQFYLENGKNQTTLGELVGQTKYVRELVVADGENYGQIVFAQGKPLTVTTVGGYTMSYDP